MYAHQTRFIIIFFFVFFFTRSPNAYRSGDERSKYLRLVLVGTLIQQLVSENDLHFLGLSVDMYLRRTSYIYRFFWFWLCGDGRYFIAVKSEKIHFDVMRWPKIDPRPLIGIPRQSKWENRVNFSILFSVVRFVLGASKSVCTHNISFLSVNSTYLWWVRAVRAQHKHVHLFYRPKLMGNSLTSCRFNHRAFGSGNSNSNAPQPKPSRLTNEHV